MHGPKIVSGYKPTKNKQVHQGDVYYNVNKQHGGHMKSVFSFQFDNYRMSILSCPWWRQFCLI